MTDSIIADSRHTLPADGLSDATSQRHLRSVRIIVPDSWAQSRAGQLTVSCLVNLLCRQPDYISWIEIVARPTRALARQPNGESVEIFPECLRRLAGWVAKESILETQLTERPADHVIVIGEADPNPPDKALLVVGHGWCAWAGTTANGRDFPNPSSRNPLGPLLAACFAAAEIFKSARGIVRGRMLYSDGFSLWSGNGATSWQDLEDGPEVDGLRFPPLHMVGCGAVGNDFAYILSVVEAADGYVVAIDDDAYDTTSLNRCLLAGWEDVGHAKVKVVARTLAAAGLGSFPFPKTLKDYLADNLTNLRKDVAEQVNNLKFGIVLSCVDRGVSRQDIQGLRPDLLMGASTLGLAARANLYPDRLGAACLACFNPAERDGEKIRALEKQLHGMSRSKRRTFFTEQGVDVDAVEAWLANPECGTTGEVAVRNLATHTAPQFSVGFVSLGAALLAMSMFLRQINLYRDIPARGDMNALNFLNGRGLDSFLAPDHACEWNCQERRMGRAAKLKVS
jgi:hypothetical protein